jgi:hypothetical protein
MACFTNFLVESRSSTSINATLKDFASGGFPVCGIDIYLACSPDVPSVVATSGASVVSTYEVELENDGVGTVFNPTISQDVILVPGDSCAIVSVAGDLISPVDLPSGDDVPIPSVTSIEPFSSVTFEVQCDTVKNPFIPMFTSKAATEDGGERLLTYSETLPDPEATVCKIDPIPQVSVVNKCTDVRLMEMEIDGAFALVVEVVTETTVMNTGDNSLFNVSVYHEEIGYLLLPAGGNTFTLAPGASITFQNQSYIPSAPDTGGVSGKHDPDTAMFTHTVTVEGEGVFSEDPFSTFESITCDLCH